ncbi:MAG TPA: F0F1 ATP synthase subunit alpha [Pirellulales bacterium]|nr:F0F1 ATP synthase subunit alpha [Pirellulales bacterium]
MPEAASDLLASVRARLAEAQWRVRRQEVGWITRVGDGVAYLRGAPSTRYGELLAHANGLTALAFDIQAREIGALFLDPCQQVSAGDELRPTGRVASVAVGEALLGRVVDSLGRPLDGGPPPPPDKGLWPVNREAPGVADRLPVSRPLHTGIKIIDALLPLGRGQRELILGDRATGKTALAIDAILAQRGGDVLCVYAAIGQRKTAVTEVINVLKQHEALAQCVVVVADADSPPGHQYLAPYTACTIGEYFMHQGRDVLVVYDDLTKHADAYRRVSLLLGRPPGREAYPPDVFYLHARLLERATHLHDRLGGGSLTALPIASTQAGHISGFIPTNLISITDGQLYLDTRLFNEGQRPAVDVGLSVSRVGGKAQPPVLRKLAGDLRLLYAQLHELETFTRFGAELEPETRHRLRRGRQLRECFKQPRLKPWRVGLEAAALFAIREGAVDRLPLERTTDFLEQLCARLSEADAPLLDRIERDDVLSSDDERSLRTAIEACSSPYTKAPDTG